MLCGRIPKSITPKLTQAQNRQIKKCATDRKRKAQVGLVFGRIKGLGGFQ